MESVFPKIEKKILKFWAKNKIFEKSIKRLKNSPVFSFYDGPPFATGQPHYGHILATTIKDAILRYKTMKGYHVPRRVGWDCHGLPVENLIEKELDIKSKRDIEKMGIEKFNDACQAAVFRYVSDFERILKRVGRWADYKNSYATMDKEYTESVWWVFKKLYEKGLVYQDLRVTPYCPRCGTPLSNFEVNQPGAYRDIQDQSIYLKFPVKDAANCYFLVWTTTPWTLPANTALAVNESIDYVQARIGREKYILAKKRLLILNKAYEVEKEFLGNTLIGREYRPPYNTGPSGHTHQIVSADFVSIDDGTGIVHIAPSFGEDDMKLGKEKNLPMIITVDQEGKIVKNLSIPGEGKPVKEANEDIKNNLKMRNLLFKEEKITHSYPFCWRCDTSLLYYPIDTWYIAVTKFKKELLANNQKIRWVPDHVKDGRFGKWLDGARDWAISRNRFWGAPLPIWRCAGNGTKKPCDNIAVAGSIDELKRLSGKKARNLHRPHIDKITFPCDKCGGTMQRTAEVFDCWFESGAMPYGQWHYPFENKKWVERTFPADFIAEGIDQTRGWFYTLHVLATALTLKKDIGLGLAKSSFKNVVVNGLLLAEDGKKLSKRLKNYTPPEDIFEKYGADTMRFFLLASTQIGEDYLVSDKRIEEIWRRTISTLWHTFTFFQTYAEASFKPQNRLKPQNLLDKWILSRLHQTIQQTDKAMNEYLLTDGVRPIDAFIDDLSNWYIRRSRRRFQKPESAKEKKEAMQTLHYVLLNLAKLSAPFIPFMAEEIYLNLKRTGMSESVHLCDYPFADIKMIDAAMEKKMATAREIVAVTLAERAKSGIKVRQPLARLEIKSKIFNSKNSDDAKLLSLIMDEINVKEIKVNSRIDTKIKLDKTITQALKEEGLVRELVRQIQEMRKHAGLTYQDKIIIKANSSSSELTSVIAKWHNFIAKEVMADKIGDDELLHPNFKNELFIEKETVIIEVKKAPEITTPRIARSKATKSMPQ